MRLLYRPKHPKANANGMVDASLVYTDGAQLGLYIISDEMAPTRHMADGRHYTSKSKFRAATKAAGCLEYGTDKSLLEPPKPVKLSREKRRDDIKRTIYDLRNGNNPFR